MKLYSNQSFVRIVDRVSAAQYTGMRFERCWFESCALSVTLDPNRRSTVRNIEIVDCVQSGSGVRAAIVEDCLVDGFDTQGQMFYFNATVFNQVTFRGRIGKLFFSPVPTFAGYSNTKDINAAFASANAEYYRNVDWAIDVSSAECLELDLRGVPSHLVRRDPETQVLLKRARLASLDWNNLSFVTQYVPYALVDFLKNQTERHDIILVAPKRSRGLKKRVQDFELLRKYGMAE